MERKGGLKRLEILKRKGERRAVRTAGAPRSGVVLERTVVIAHIVSLILGETHLKASQIAQMQFVLWP
jgi:hypothetical protein